MTNIDQSIASLIDIAGAIGACIVDYTSGMMLGGQGSSFDLELAAAGNTEVVRAKMNTMKTLGISGSIEDILITLDSQFHIIKPSQNHQGLFIYLVLDKTKANLALARRQVQQIETALVV